ncbi:MAG: helix-turn-helix domain-containing protein [Thermoplasmatota archaeon]
MKREGTAGLGRILSTFTALALCLLAIFSFSAISQEITDNDQDGMDDEWEAEHGLNSTDPSDADGDPDGDGLTNVQEYRNSTDPGSNDTDSDGMDDGWEVAYGLDPNDPSDADGDLDDDGYSNLAEHQMGSDPTDPSDPSVVDDDDDDVAPGAEEDEEGSSALIAIWGIFFLFLAAAILVGLTIGIYSKIRKDRLLDHETRQRIVDYLKENPGAYYSQIRKDLDLAHGVLTHHINMLEQQELLFSRQDRSYRRFFLDGMYKKGPIVVGNQKKVLDAVRKDPGSSQSKIGKDLGMGRMIVSYHIGQLDELGLVERFKRGRENLVYPKNGTSAQASDDAPVKAEA